MTTATQTSIQTSTGTAGTIRSTTGVRIAGLPAEVLDIVRSGGMDASGNPPVRVVAEGGEPVRCCLRDAREGEELVLFGYAPRLPASPYRETGAVFAHARTCPAPPAPGYPREWLGRPQVLRAYDARGWIHPHPRRHRPRRRPGPGARRAGGGAGAQPQRGLRLLDVHRCTGLT
jgi:hypothetical protein